MNYPQIKNTVAGQRIPNSKGKHTAPDVPISMALAASMNSLGLPPGVVFGVAPGKFDANS